MFVSLPTAELEVPASLNVPGARHWRAVQLSPQLSWFIACFGGADGIDTSRVTMCFAWDQDLVSAIGALETDRLLDLVCMLPPWSSSTGRWEAKTIVAVHRAIDSDQPDSYLFETDDGAYLTGMGRQLAGTAQRGELVARVPRPDDVAARSLRGRTG